MEKAIEFAEEENIDQYSTIIDLKNFQISKFPPMSVIKPIMHVFSNHYPQRVGFLIFLNTGKTFRFLWKLFTPFISKKSRHKVSFIPSSKQQSELEKLLDLRMLELSLGGTSDHSFDLRTYLNHTCNLRDSLSASSRLKDEL